MKDQEILNLFDNACELLLKNKRVEEARKVIQEIDRVWAERSALSREGQYKGDSPKKGLLSTMHYHVGMEATPEPKRRLILDQILTKNVPFVPPPSYMDEWGEPRTQERMRKLEKVIKELVNDAQHRRGKGKDFEKAISEWQSDLDYIRKNYNF
ncbi:hypothetical protein OAL10_02280 [Gammaproteobacteria bacterium]|nr:hypothetical protein [Gammaproteobacteria bacterium]